MAQVMVGEFELPAIVGEMLRLGTWPTDDSDYFVVSPVPEHLVRAVLPDESGFCLLAPPFRTLELDERISHSRWWKKWLEGFRHTDEIDYSKAVMVADFGPGSENPIVLDYRRTPPQVMALACVFHRDAPGSGRGEWEGHWVVLASTLEELLDKLGLR
jgi:hypothetical protein